MANHATSFGKTDLHQHLNQILTTGEVSRQEYFRLMSFFLSDFAVSSEERRLLNQIFDELQMNRLQFTNQTTNLMDES
ncbi:MAG: hypothetical protein SAJ12_22685 [Jaaginema sp. PMC 1079.18]|nr:hypothetical protein [Jaaginema sp. PMC 1080.18]MEC4853797.1 hypothetical protein [Jaaginema sp. PMC 1079.18]MEC4866592.1 hypothetical protein [Jaaginema sp. PMC 1078.18]